MKVYIVLCVLAVLMMGVICQDATTVEDSATGTDAQVVTTEPSPTFPDNGAGVLQVTLVSLLLPALAALFQ